MAGETGKHELAIVMRLKDELTREFQRAARTVESGGAGMARSMEANARNAMRLAQGVMRGITTITATAAGAEKNIVGIGLTLASAFAAGGPAGLAVAGTGTLLGLLVGHLSDVKREATEARAVFEREMKAIRDAADQVAEATARRRGESRLRGEIGDLEYKIAESGRDFGGLDISGARTLQKYDSSQALKDYVQLLEKGRQLEDLLQQQEIYANEAIKERLDLLEADSELRKKVLAIEKEARGFLADGGRPKDVESFRTRSIEKVAQEEFERVQKVVADAVNAIASMAADGTVEGFRKAATERRDEVVRSIEQAFGAGSGVAPKLFSDAARRQLVDSVDSAVREGSAAAEAGASEQAKSLFAQTVERIRDVRAVTDSQREQLEIQREIRDLEAQIAEVRKRGGEDVQEYVRELERARDALREALGARSAAAVGSGIADGVVGDAPLPGAPGDAEYYRRIREERFDALRGELTLLQQISPYLRERLEIEQQTAAALRSIDDDPNFQAHIEDWRELVAQVREAKLAALEYARAAARADLRLPFEERLDDLEFENSKFGLSPEGQQLADLDRAVREEGKSIEFAALRGDIDSGLRDRLRAELAVYRDETAKFIRELGDPFVETIRGVGPQVVSALTHMGVQGFKGWEDAAKSLLLSLSGQFLNAGLTSLGKSIPFFSQFFAAQSGGVFEVGDATQFPARRFAGGGLTDYGRPEIIMVGEGAKREAVVPLPDGRSIPVQMRGGAGGGNVNINLSVNVGGGGGFLDLSPDDQIRIILSHVERGLRGRWAQAVAARVQGALI